MTRQAAQNAEQFHGQLRQIDQTLQDAREAAVVAQNTAVSATTTTIGRIERELQQAIGQLDKEWNKAADKFDRDFLKRDAKFHRDVDKLLADQGKSAADAADTLTKALEDASRRQRDTIQQTAQAAADALRALTAAMGSEEQVINRQLLTYGNLVGRMITESEAWKQGEAMRNVQLAFAENARKAQEILDKAQRARQAMDEKGLEAQESIEDITRNAAEDAAEQREQIIERLTELAEAREAQERDAFDQGLEGREALEDRAAELQAQAQERIGDALLTQGRAMAAAAAQLAAAETAAAEARRAEARRFDESLREQARTRAQFERQLEQQREDRQRQEAEAFRQRDETLRQAARAEAAVLRELRALRAAVQGRGPLQNVNIPSLVVQETGVEMVAEYTEALRRHMAAGTVG
jgi:hypothetical protein